MGFHISTRVSASDRWIAATLAAFSMFVVGYTATRVYLSQPAAPTTTADTQVVGHQASMWSALGE